MSTFIDGSLDRTRALYLLTMQDAAYRAMADHWPRPRWVKYKADGDNILVMVWLNRACAETFGIDPYKLIGHCDRACFNDEMSSCYARTDHEAIACAGQILECTLPDPRGGEVRALKLAIRIDNKELQGWFVYGECP